MLDVEGKHFGLIGRLLSHSFSKKYFEEKFSLLGMNGYSYELIELDNLEGLRDMVESFHLSGFNVTIPYKQVIMPLLDDIDPDAAEIGAVNTVSVRRNGRTSKLCGHNTDAPAFLATLQPYLKPHHKEALILGTGGAAQAVAWALRRCSIDYHFVSRTPERQEGTISYEEAARLADSTTVIINATPVGMFPYTEVSAWPFPDLLTRRHLCYDLIYNPSPTLFLRNAEKSGATTIGGLAMLHMQADLSWEIWSRDTFIQQ